ncbi:unnamed protein product [Clonostachys rosea f. rosea IK726]|jgi:hypothetical protein|uniref:Uncharacterized protein n=1 Tax=Clonostachys rosea f. rosea IK726 TaxID=1349383 RepID=A0ACA9UKN7_BIOOC|nr:unnamed protein product [Clonostachys rosea f. rosea IK726]
MRHLSTTVEKYLGLLQQDKTQREVLKVSDADQYRRPEVSNSVLKTWRISAERIQVESEMSYQMLHVITYVDSQDIPHELMAAAASQYNTESPMEMILGETPRVKDGRKPVNHTIVA